MMSPRKRNVLFAAFDVDNDRYTRVSLAWRSLFAALAERDCVKGYGHMFPPSTEVGAHHAVEHAEVILSGRPA